MSDRSCTYPAGRSAGHVDGDHRLSMEIARPPGRSAVATMSQNGPHADGGTCESQNEKKTVSYWFAGGCHSKMSASMYSTRSDPTLARLILSTSGDASTAVMWSAPGTRRCVQMPVPQAI